MTDPFIVFINVIYIDQIQPVACSLLPTVP